MSYCDTTWAYTQLYWDVPILGIVIIHVVSFCLNLVCGPSSPQDFLHVCSTFTHLPEDSITSSFFYKFFAEL